MAAKEARSSSTNSAGCSKAAKWPPRSGSLQYRMSVKRRSAQRREGRGVSLKTGAPNGVSTVSVCAPVNQSLTVAKLSQYSRVDEAPVPVSQYRLMLSRIWSRLSTANTSPSWSHHSTNFSEIQAHCPAGESKGVAERLWPSRVLGRVSAPGLCCCHEHSGASRRIVL